MSESMADVEELAAGLEASAPFILSSVGEYGMPHLTCDLMAKDCWQAATMLRRQSQEIARLTTEVDIYRAALLRIREGVERPDDEAYGALMEARQEQQQ